MRVTIVAGGVPSDRYPIHGIFEYTQAKAIASAGIEVCYLALDFRPLSVRRHWGLQRFNRDGIHIYHFSLPTGIYRRGLCFLQKLALLLFLKIEKEQGHQDILHTHFYSISAICALIPLKTGIKLVATEHSSKLNKPLTEISNLDCKVARTAYSNTAAVIAVSDCLALRLQDNFKINSTIIGNIVNPEFTDIKHANHKGFNILSVGRLIKGKRFDDLIRAFSSISHPDVTLTIIGAGPEQIALQNLIDELGLNSRVTLYGSADSETIRKLMSEADLFALLSESETFGVAYAEALTAGIPVIATHCGGPEGFVTAENGIQVDVGDVNGVAKAIYSVIDGSIKFTEDKIRRSVSQFEPSVVADKLIKLYNSVLR